MRCRRAEQRRGGDEALDRRDVQDERRGDTTEKQHSTDALAHDVSTKATQNLSLQQKKRELHRQNECPLVQCGMM